MHRAFDIGLRARSELVADDRFMGSAQYCLLHCGRETFLKLFERVYAPLTAGLLSPIKADAAGIMQVTIWKSSVGADQDIQSSLRSQ